MRSEIENGTFSQARLQVTNQTVVLEGEGFEVDWGLKFRCRCGDSERTFHLFDETTMSQEMRLFGTGKSRQHRRGAFTPPARNPSRY